LRVLLIGIDAYQGGVPALHGCVNDIDAVQRLLLDRVGVSPGDVVRLASPHDGDAHEGDVVSAPATRANVVRALGALGGEGTRGDDRVFIYYSGHGVSVPVIDRGYRTVREALVPVDASVSGGAADGLLLDFELSRLLGAVAKRTRHVTFVLDCCHAGGATRDLAAHPGDRERSLRVDAPLTLAPGAVEGSSAAGARGVIASASAADVQVVAACLSDEKALESDASAGRKHGLLTHALVQALDAVAPSELPTLAWGRIWRQVVAEVERRRPQHPTLTGSFARLAFGGAHQDGDVGIGVTREGDGYRLDAGELSGVTTGALLAVYGSEPALFPPAGSADDLRVRVGVVRVGPAKRSAATGAAVGATFELPQGARARLVEAGEAARLPVALSPGDPELEALIDASPLLRLARGEESAVVRVVSRADGRLALVDALHGAGEEAAEAYLIAIPPSQRRATVAVLEQYHRYAAPLRMAESCSDFPGALRVEVLDCNGRELDEDGCLRLPDPQRPDLPDVLTGPEGFYEHRHDDLVAFRVVNTSHARLKVTLFDCAPEGAVSVLGEEVLGPGTGRVFWWDAVPGRPFPMSVLAGRRVSLDRVVAVGTSAVERSLRHLQTAPGETFAAALAAEYRAVGAGPSRFPTPERWTATRATLRTRA